MDKIEIKLENGKQYVLSEVLEKLANKKRWDYHSKLIEQVMLYAVTKKDEALGCLQNILNDLSSQNLI